MLDGMRTIHFDSTGQCEREEERQDTTVFIIVKADMIVIHLIPNKSFQLMKDPAQ